MMSHRRTKTVLKTAAILCIAVIFGEAGLPQQGRSQDFSHVL